MTERRQKCVKKQQIIFNMNKEELIKKVTVCLKVVESESLTPPQGRGGSFRRRHPWEMLEFFSLAVLKKGFGN